MTADTKTSLDLLGIVEKASTMAERLSGAFVPAEATGEAESAAMDARLQRWRQNAARGDQAQFEKRLAWDGLTPDSVRPLLGPVRLADGQPLPGWLSTLDEALSSLPVSVEGSHAADRCLDDTAPIPFQEVWLPFIRLARQRLSANSGYPLLSAEAHASLERALLVTLATLGSQALYVEFTAYQALRSPTRLLDFIQPDDTSDQAPPFRARYDQFVQHLLNGGLIDFFKEYAVAARLSALVTDHWVESTALFLNRLAADLPDLRSEFAANADPGTVIDVTADLSDPHRNGQSVIAVRFASGLKLVYKPRDIGLEAAYNRLLAWLNDQGIPPAFKVLKILERPTHGWVEYVEHLPCQTEDEAAAYYRRAGMHLGLFYLLRGSDAHHGNLIACGPHPVIIDLEVLLNPVLADDSQVDTPDLPLYRNTVLTSGLLPIWDRAPDGALYDMSGLGGSSGGQNVVRPEWHAVNTDRMRLIKRSQALPETSAVPYLDQTALSPVAYVDEIVAGFQQMVRFILDRRAIFQAPAGPFAAFRHQRARFVFRNTSLYDQLRQLAFAPRLMKDGADQRIHFELACLALMSPESKPIFWPLLKEEVRALEQMDIPLFGMLTDEKAVFSDTDAAVVANAFVDDGYRLTARALDSLGESDIALQSGLVRAAIITKRTGRPVWQTADEPSVPDPAELPLLTPARFIEEAVQIADRLQRSAIRFGSGMSWITLEYTAELERYELKPVDHSLYSGLLGIALFLGALARATGERSYRDQTLAVLHDLRADLARGDIHRAAQIGQRLGLGSAYGIGAVVYGLTRLSAFLDDDSLLAEARRASALLTPQRIADDTGLDVFSGAAGAILGLLALYDQSPEQRLLDLARLCGQHLLDRRTASAAGPRAWVTLNDALLTGFSHGAAGIAYALTRLYDKVRETGFLEAACEAEDYERSVFSPQAGNWPDFRFPASGAPVFTTSWCHGAPGIALARLGSLNWIDSEDTRRDIEAALDTTRKLLFTGQDVDHLCCGTLGRVETLWKAGQVLGRPDLLEAARRASTNVVYRSKQRGSYCLFAGLPDGLDNPGFFQGTAGIGYQWLRLADPDRFPSVLIWE